VGPPSDLYHPQTSQKRAIINHPEMVVVYGFMAFFTTFFRETPVQEKG